nr:GNAT family N-acetyltransferase [Rhizobium sp. L1K21]
MPAERSFSEHLDRFLSSGQSTSAQSASASIHVGVYTDIDAIRDVWKQLEAYDSNSLHHCFDWCRAWLKAHGTTPLVVVVSLAGKPVILLPLEKRKTTLGAVAEFIGANHANINTGLIDPEFAKSASFELKTQIVNAIKRALKAHVCLISLTNMPDHWQGVPNPFSGSYKVENQNHAFQLPIRKTFEETLAQINAKRRRKKFRKSTRLMDDMGGFEHIIATTPEEKAELLKTFFAQKRVRFEDAGIPDAFAEPEIKFFFKNLADLPQEDNNYLLKLHAIRLKKDGHIASVASLSRKGNHIICQFSSIDETFTAEASPGELLFHFMIEDAHDTGVEIFDFGLGYMRYKSSWCPVETVQYDVLIPTALRGMPAAAFAAASTRAKAWIKQNDRLYRFLQSRRAA